MAKTKMQIRVGDTVEVIAGKDRRAGSTAGASSSGPALTSGTPAPTAPGEAGASGSIAA